ncbi:serine hydrolase domain-containing protein [Mesorhizobium sp. 2RAF21]|uniref:serine hydrolase domain-containing protein n=1 Tax=Mesorhizobium sp. 2RAF21 TaxID=3232995 RepID=UPI003F96CAC2
MAGTVDITKGAEEGVFLAAAAFIPSRAALPARETLEGRLHLLPTVMRLDPADPRRYGGLAARLDLFPAIACGLVCSDGQLRWETQAPLSGFANRSHSSFWNVLLQPGRAWSEPQDEGWSRASFPFALVNPLENETYNGLALFGYRDGRVTPIRFQIEQQTAPYILQDYMKATGITDARFEAGPVSLPVPSDSFECLPWSRLVEKTGAPVLEPFDDAVRSVAPVASGIDFEGDFYLRQFFGREDQWLYPAETRLGIWSVTKSAMAGLAALRLAQIFGEAVLDEPIVDHVPELRDAPGWKRVFLRHALCMATGIGSKADGYVWRGLDEEGIAPGYRSWYFAQSAADKLSAIAADSIAEEWEPGTVFRYRDQDLFTVGLAMDRLARKRLGRTIETVLREDVYGPIGIGETSWSTTVEAAGEAGVPLWAIGYYPTLGDLVRIARLIHAGGALQGRQILCKPLIRQIFEGGGVVAEPFGDVKCNYFLTFWCASLPGGDGRDVVVPIMLGFGGNEVVLAPNAVTMIRVAKEKDPETNLHNFRDVALLGLELARHVRSLAPHGDIRADPR